MWKTQHSWKFFLIKQNHRFSASVLVHPRVLCQKPIMSFKFSLKGGNETRLVWGIHPYPSFYRPRSPHFFSWLTLHSLVANILSLAGKITVSAGWKSCFTDNIPVFCLVQDSFGGEIQLFSVSKITMFCLVKTTSFWGCFTTKVRGCRHWSSQRLAATGDLPAICNWCVISTDYDNPIWFESNLL